MVQLTRHSTPPVSAPITPVVPTPLDWQSRPGSQPQTQLQRQTALEQEDGLAALIANPVKDGCDDHGV